MLLTRYYHAHNAVNFCELALDSRTLEPSVNDLASSVEFFRINQAGPPFFEICVAGLTKLDILRFSPNDASFSHFQTIPVPTVPRGR